jgi:TPP-dependent pyruvate/acetoin dehydrogenase alpha subunit
MTAPSTPASTRDLDATIVAMIHRTMVRIRVFETRVQELFLAGELPGFVHTYLGQEAIAAGVCANLTGDDLITSTHRGHGHGIGKGMSTDVLMAELYGKETGANKGRGGSMHVADFSLGMLGANGIVGGGFGIAAGAGMSAQLRGSEQVVVCFFGDGATNKGSFHEALNFAAVRDLPVVYLCENNQYAQFTAISRTSSVDDLSIRAASYGIEGLTLDGNDAGAVYTAAALAVAKAREGGGPTLLNCITYRHGGHYVGDAEVYRDRTEVEEWKHADPIERLERAIIEAGWADLTATRLVWDEAGAEIEAAHAFALASIYPDPSTALDYVYTDPPP